MNKNIWIINHYAYPFGYGFHTRQHSLSLILKEIGYNVVVFSSSFNHLKTKDVHLDSLYKEETIDGIQYRWIKTDKYNTNGFSRVRNIFQFSRNLHKIYRSFSDKPDIVWVSSPHPFSIFNGLEIKKEYKCKFIFEERDIWPLTLQVINGLNKLHPISIIFRYLELQAYKQSDLIMTPLSNLKEFIEKSGVYQKKIVVVPQPYVDFDEEVYDIDLPTNSFIIGYIGSIGESNSVFNLIKAANMLKKYKDIYFLIVGDGPQLLELKNFVKENEILNIKFTGKVKKEHAKYLLGKCDLLYKGHPDIELYKYGLSAVKLSEYMSSGKPIIHAVNIKNDPVQISKCGLSIEPDNEDILKDSILNLKEDNILYESLCNNGIKYVENNFSYDVIKTKLKKVIGSL